jgi:hypothetical protein
MTPPLLWKIYIYENVLLILYYKYQNNLYIYQKFHEINGFTKLRAVSKLSIFLYTLYTAVKLYCFGIVNILVSRASRLPGLLIIRKNTKYTKAVKW